MCFAPSTDWWRGVPTKPPLESSLKKLTPQFVYRPRCTASPLGPCGTVAAPWVLLVSVPRAAVMLHPRRWSWCTCHAVVGARWSARLGVCMPTTPRHAHHRPPPPTYAHISCSLPRALTSCGWGAADCRALRYCSSLHAPHSKLSPFAVFCPLIVADLRVFVYTCWPVWRVEVSIEWMPVQRR